MFSRKPSLPIGKSLPEMETTEDATATPLLPPAPIINGNFAKRTLSTTSNASPRAPSASPINTAAAKRTQKTNGAAPPAKRTKSGPQSAEINGKGQQSLKGFFRARVAPVEVAGGEAIAPVEVARTTSMNVEDFNQDAQSTPPMKADEVILPSPAKTETSVEEEAATFASKQTWGKLFARPIAPKCEHDEPCKTMQTRKPGVNCGRSFWMCNRPLGPSGKQEKSTQWRCNTFIWSSDWDGHAGGPG